MALSAGTKLGPYEILSALGAGGMGEVWRARDSRLDRDVAIKVLPDVVEHDAERLLRFEREAKVLASLSHPNVAAVFGFEQVDGRHLLILEFVDGPTLADRLRQGALPVDEALEIGRQIAEALDAAHEKGIIHRDLKPANVKVTHEGKVKVLDFGLAKALLGDGSSATSHSPTEFAHSPTITEEYTRPGVILGTAGYMSPEQARGRSVDKRTDIWAFGCVLFECLSGARLFAGETTTDSIGALLHKEPEWALLPPGSPPTIQLLLRRCLAKDRNKRLRDIGDARIELENVLADPTSSMLRLGDAALSAAMASGRRPAWRRSLPWAICVVLIVALGALWFAMRPEPPHVMRLTMAIPDTQALSAVPGTTMDISPDGTRVVFVGKCESGRQLYLRQLHQPDALPMPGTDDAFGPFFSPDGEWIAFCQKGKLRKISALGGPAATLCDAANLRGGSWGSDGTIVFAPEARSGIWKVASAGGEPVELTDAGAGAATPSNRWPHLLPDGKTALFTATDKNSEYTNAKIIAVSLETGEQKVVVEGGTYARYVPTGHIIFGRAATLMAMPFDAKKLEASGAAIPFLEGVLGASTYGSFDYAISDAGILLYVGGSAGGEEEVPIWIDREGKETPISQHKLDYTDVRISPDGTRLAAAIGEAGNYDIWILELERDSYTRLTVDESVESNPRWSPDGKWVIYSSNRGNSSFNLFRQLADGTGEAQRLTTSENPQTPSFISPDGSTVFFTERPPKTDVDILYLDLSQEGSSPQPFLATPFREGSPALSPDGKWIAYLSNEAGDPEIFVRPFLRPGAKLKVSAGRGFIPSWSPDGKEIYYRDEGKIFAVSVSVQDDAIRVSNPRVLFEVQGNLFGGPYYGPHDVSSDGNRFLFYRPAGEIKKQSLQPTVVVNWFEELKSKVRAGKK